MGKNHISIHTSPEGSDERLPASGWNLSNFNPHFPWGKWQVSVWHLSAFFVFQSTLPLREVTWTGVRSASSTNTFQSTLPLREVTYPYQIHLLSLRFQSTLPLREVTRERKANAERIKFQSTLPLREVTKDIRRYSIQLVISIHTSPEGSDTC